MGGDREHTITESGPEGEDCQRCGGPNVAAWFAPSPLWNLVMRGNNIDGEARFGDTVCPACFIRCAEEAGVSGTWKLTVDPAPEGLVLSTPSGRVWDDTTGLWVVEAATEQVRPTDLIGRTLVGWSWPCSVVQFTRDGGSWISNASNDGGPLPLDADGMVEVIAP